VDFNFFQWLREGVKHSILLGVNDAVEEIGAPEGTSGEALQFLRTNGKAAIGTKSSGSRTRRLGRSLKDMDSNTGTKKKSA
jgi:hypothetical protein